MAPGAETRGQTLSNTDSLVTKNERNKNLLSHLQEKRNVIALVKGKFTQHIETIAVDSDVTREPGTERLCRVPAPVFSVLLPERVAPKNYNLKRQNGGIRGSYR